jgi:hypothetical protein
MPVFYRSGERHTEAVRKSIDDDTDDTRFSFAIDVVWHVPPRLSRVAKAAGVVIAAVAAVVARMHGHP